MPAPVDLALLAGLAFLAFYVMGVTGAANAIVFNAGFVVLANVGWITLGLHDALYWLALANFAAGALLAVILRDRLTLDAVVGRYLLAMVPTTILFAAALPFLRARDLGLVLAIALLVAGVLVGARPLSERISPSRAAAVAAPTGAAAGGLAGLFGMGGPVTMVFFAATTDSRAIFRARVVTVGLVTSLVRVLVLGAEGIVTVDRMLTFAVTLPAIVAGIAVGHATHARFGPRVFTALLGIVVFLAGVTTLTTWMTGG